MNIEFIKQDKEKNKSTFLVKDIDASFANALRRIMLEEVPVMAIEDVEIRKNNSVLYDEMMTHRLGLVPLKTDLKSYNLPEECSCKGEGCAKCQLKMVMKVKGACNVYASDIDSQDPKVKPVHPKMLINKLMKGQEIELEATAVLGKGKEHMKWSPGLAYYMYEPKITVNNNSNKFEEFKDKYPPQVMENGKIKKELINTSELINACDGICEDIVKVEYNERNFLFTIESWGQLGAKEIAKTAAEILEAKSEDFVEKAKALK